MGVYTAGAIIFIAILVSIVYMVINGHPGWAGIMTLALFSIRISEDDNSEDDNKESGPAPLKPVEKGENNGRSQ